MRKKRMTAIAAAAAVLGGTLSSMPAGSVSAAPAFDYAKALQMSLYFYECQQAGKLPEWNRVEWRGDAGLEDGLLGGWFDAGDHVKFNLPMSYSASMLGWGLYAYPDGVEAAGEMTNYVNNLKWALDYFVDCDLGESVIYQVGNGQKDHTWWGPCELLEYGMKDQGNVNCRGVLKGRDCSAVTAQMASALTIGTLALKGRVDDAVLNNYLKHALNMFKMADADRSDAVYNKSDAQSFYESRQFYDDLFFCANWLYMATKDDSYLEKAASYIPNLGREMGQGDTLKYSWCQCWDDVQQGATILYAINTGKSDWKDNAKRHLDYWLNSKDIVPGGLIYVQNWGCLRHANAFAFTCAYACDHLFKDDPDYDKYVALYEKQVNFALGDNPTKQCYVVGYADNSPKRVHHRTAHGSWKNAEKIPDLNRHVLYGALAGGPKQDGSYNDDRGDYINNEVATDYNAGYTAMLCKMLDVYGGKSDPNFPYPETRDEEFYVEAKATSDSGGTTVSMKITNHTAWPARIVDNISMRYYMDLSEIADAGIDPTSIEMRIDRDQSAMYASDNVKTAEISKPIQYKGNIYYIEVNFPDGRAMMPISEGQYQCEILLALVYPNYGKGWDATNDFSAKGLGGTSNTKTAYIPVYENGVLISGEEPDGTVGKGSISANPAPGSGKQDPPSATTTTKETVKETTTTLSETTTEPVKTTTTTTVTTTSDGKGTPANGLWGDANESDNVDVSDAVLTAKFASGDSTAKITDNGKKLADVDGDGNVTPDDTTKILKYIAKLITAEELAPSK